MRTRSKGILGKLAMLTAVVALVGAGIVAVASANNLDRRTATNAARKAAKQDCRNTSGCQAYKVLGLHKVSRHKAVGKIGTLSTKNGVQYVCTRQVVIKLDPYSDRYTWKTSRRHCHPV